MSEDLGQTLRDKEERFLGTVTASASHEINNVLAIINEYAGLLDDLCRQADQGSAQPDLIGRQALLKPVASILQQIRRGQTIVKRLNRFAHLVDEPRATVDLNLLIEDICAHARRLADLKRVELDFRPSPTTSTLHGHPMRIQHVVFACLQWILEVSSQAATLTVGLKIDQTHATIDIHCPRTLRLSPPSAPARAILDLLAREAGATLRLRESEEGFAFELVFVSSSEFEPDDAREK